MTGHRAGGPRSGRETLDAMIGDARRRWRLRVALRGIAVVLAAAFVALVIGAYLLEQSRFTPGSVLAARALVGLVVLVAGARLIVWPLLRAVPDDRVALYLEEHEPSLGASLVSALAVRDRHGTSDALAGRVVAQATERARAVQLGRRVERGALRRGAATAAGVAALAVAAVVAGPPFLRSGARAMLWPWGAGGDAVPVYAIDVRPGDASVPRGGDLGVAATLRGFSEDEAVVLLRRGAGLEWERVPMIGRDSAGNFAGRLLALDSAAEYSVEAGRVRSPVYRIAVVDRPYARRVSLEYRFPGYTGLAAQRVEDGGDVAAPRGTSVIVTVTPSAPARAGRLIVDGAAPVALTLGDSGVLTGSMRVERDGFYRVELTGADGATGPASLDYTIDVLSDRPPTVTVAEPGRDLRVTRLEEVFASVEAEDDYGVAAVDLVYSVNGGGEQTVALHRAGARRTPDVTAGHTFFLEEMPLQPGDVVSYYARARDNDAVSGAHGAATDIYFLQVRPFGQTYRQADQQGGQGGGRREESPNALSERQRQIVSATFKVLRDSALTTERQRREDLTTLALAQGRLREQVTRLADRMMMRGGTAVASDSSLRQIAEALPLAAAAMGEAEERLGRRAPADALPHEQRALQQLLRAEAAFREVQVSFGGGGSGSEGGGDSSPEELADLFGLEADRLQNQYESVQRGGQEERTTSAEVDRTMERLRELASRQLRESERMRREAEAMRQRQPQSGGGGGGGGSAGDAQRQMAQEAEQLARRLERLTRDDPSPALQRSLRELQAAADAMRRAAAANGEAGAASAAAARERLEQARRLLGERRTETGERALRDAQRQAAELADEQRRVAAAAERLARGEGRGADAERRVLDDKSAMEERVGALERDLDRLAREMRREQPDAAGRLQGAADAIRDGQLRERLRFSRDVARGGRSAEYARNLEEQIGSTLDDVRRRVDAAAGAVREPSERAGNQAVERARELARGVESMGERMQQRREGQGGAQGARPGEQGGRTPGGSAPGQQGGQQQGAQEGGQQGGGAAPGGAQPGTQSPGEPGGGGRGIAVGGGRGRLSAEDVRQLTREMAQRRADAEELRRSVGRQGMSTKELEELIGRMRALENARVYDDPEEAARLQSAVADGLKAFEFALRRRVEGEPAEQLRLGAADDVPAEFRRLVEEYYRSLARTQR